MSKTITGTTIQDLHNDLDMIIATSAGGDAEKAEKLLELYCTRLKQELIPDLNNS
ncbi:TPA: hypothetical protein NJ689_000728 [Vibrio parahaemolyticus]|nr:hypothetical protein [Vibrio parahaemolyticus]